MSLESLCHSTALFLVKGNFAPNLLASQPIPIFGDREQPLAFRGGTRKESLMNVATAPIYSDLLNAK